MAALTAEQQAAAHAPLDEALVVLAAAGTGKTTTMLERVRFALQQGVPAEQVLVLTFSRRAQSEFAARLQQRVPAAEQATVSTFHAWAWQLVRRHWREAGFAQQPTVAAAEEQLDSVMRDCLTWDGLEALRASMAGWLWLPPTAPWAEVAAAAAERHAALHARCLAAAVSAFKHDAAGSLTTGAAAALPWDQLPPRVQLLLICELHDALATRFRQRQRGGGCEGATAADLLAGAAKQAPAILQWLDSQKRQGRAVDEQAYLAACAAAHAASEQGQGAGGGSRGGADPERQRRLVRAGLAFQQAMCRLSLVALSDLPLLARQLLAAGGAAAAWARQRWSVVLVDEFQDTGRVLLDLLSLLLGDRRSVTAVGDDDQSIYSFLGTEPRIFRDFQARFAPCATRCLQLNFRSSPHICALGSSLLRGNRRAAEKSMQPARHSWSNNAGGGSGFTPVIVQQHASPEAEAAALAAEVQRLWREEGVPYSSVAVLFRCLRLQGGAPHAPLVAALRTRGIPFTIANHDRLGDDPAVGALCAYLALAADPGCDPAFEAVLSLPHHGLGAEVRSAVTQQRQAARLAGRPLPSLLDCAESVCSQAAAAAAADQVAAADLEQEQFGPTQLSQLAGQLSQLNREDREELKRLVALLRRMRTAVGREPLPNAVLGVLQESGLVDWLRQQQLLEGGGEAAAKGKRGGGAVEQLPPNLRAVLHKARQVMVEWQQAQQQEQQQAQQQLQHQVQQAQQQVQQVQQQADGEQAAAADAGAADQGRTGEGAALVKELLARLAMETKADDAAEDDGQGSDQPGDAASAAGEAARQEQSPSAWWGQQQAEGPGPGMLTISTIHAAKGLEWPVVLIPFANEGHLPLAWRPPAALLADWRAAAGVAERDVAEMRRAHHEEERRLFHVAATRARDRLLISYVQPAAAVAEPDVAVTSLQASQGHPALPQDIPRCSSVLAATVRRLLRQQPEAVRLEGQLPDKAFPGLAGESLSLEEEERSQQHSQQQQQPQGTAAAAATGRVLAAGGNARPATQQLSIAERVRRQLAAKAAAKAAPAKAAPAKAAPAGKAAPAKAALGGRKRQAAQMDGADQRDLCGAA